MFLVLKSLEMWYCKHYGRTCTDKSIILNQLGMDRMLMAKVTHMKFVYFGHVMRGSVGELALLVMEVAIEIERWLEWSGRARITQS